MNTITRDLINREIKQAELRLIEERGCIERHLDAIVHHRKKVQTLTERKQELERSLNDGADIAAAGTADGEATADDIVPEFIRKLFGDRVRVMRMDLSPHDD